MAAAAAAARRLLSRRASSPSLSALLRRGTAAAATEQPLLRSAVVSAASRLGFPRGMARRPGGDGYSPARPGGGGGDRAPTEMAPLFPGCDYEHWLIVMDKPGGEGATKQQMIDCYVQTFAKVLGRYSLLFSVPPSFKRKKLQFELQRPIFANFSLLNLSDGFFSGAARRRRRGRSTTSRASATSGSGAR